MRHQGAYELCPFFKSKNLLAAMGRTLLVVRFLSIIKSFIDQMNFLK